MSDDCRHTKEYVWIKYDLDRSTTHPKLDLTGVQPHDLEPDHGSTFHVTETPFLTTLP